MRWERVHEGDCYLHRTKIISFDVPSFFSKLLFDVNMLYEVDTHSVKMLVCLLPLEVIIKTLGLRGGHQVEVKVESAHKTDLQSCCNTSYVWKHGAAIALVLIPGWNNSPYTGYLMEFFQVF